MVPRLTHTHLIHTLPDTILLVIRFLFRSIRSPLAMPAHLHHHPHHLGITIREELRYVTTKPTMRIGHDTITESVAVSKRGLTRTHSAGYDFLSFLCP